MNAHKPLILIATIFALTIAALACGPLGSGGGGGGGSQPITGTVAPMTIGSDLTQIDVCAAVPQAMMEQLMGRKLAGPPEKFNDYDTPGASGCQFSAGKDASGQAFYSYVALTPVNVYDEQPLHLNKAVSGIGDEAYFNNGADARQLWVRIKGKVAFVVAQGDVENEAGMTTVAQLVAAAIK